MTRVFRTSPLEAGKTGPRPARRPAAEASPVAPAAEASPNEPATRRVGGGRVLKPGPMQAGQRSAAASAAFSPPRRAPRVTAPTGHNQGPPLTGGFKLFAWRKAQAEAWKPPLPETLRRRLKYAAECGLTYREYTLEIMERGRWLTPEKDAARIAEIIAWRN